MVLVLLAASTFQPVSTEADVVTSGGSRYRLETCFRDPRHLQTRFVYPDRVLTFTIENDGVTTSDGQKTKEGGDAEKRFALGHQFHAIYYNLPEVTSDLRQRNHKTEGNLRPGQTGTMLYGGSVTPLYSEERSLEGLHFELPETAPIQLRFSDWRGPGRTPYRIKLLHDGTTYVYTFKKIAFRC